MVSFRRGWRGKEWGGVGWGVEGGMGVITLQLFDSDNVPMLALLIINQ